MKRVILVSLAAFLVLTLPASAKGKPGTLSLGVLTGGQSSAWVEQQDDWPMPSLPITNPYGGTCAWSVNDHKSRTSFGYLDGGSSAQGSACVVSDFNPVLATRFGTTASWSMAPYGFFGVAVNQPALDVEVCYQPQGRCFAPESSFCGRANYAPDDPALQEIAGSNGGRGVVTTITLTVFNPTNRRIRDIVVSWGISSDVFFPGACATLPTNGEYPFVSRAG